VLDDVAFSVAGGAASPPPASPPDDDVPSVPAPSEPDVVGPSEPRAFPALDPARREQAVAFTIRRVDGLPSVMRTSPDIYALEVMNEILGGSGGTSRITKTVRSNEGLAYSAGSGLAPGVWFPGRFRAGFQSKSRTVPWATELVFGEIRRIRDESVTPEELSTIKNSLVQTFPSSFASKAQAMGIFASDEYTRRDPAYWATYRDRIQAVTAADVQRVARAHLVPEKMVVLVVGDQKQIDLGDPKHPVALASLAPGGKVTTLPLRDPMTMKPLP